MRNNNVKRGVKKVTDINKKFIEEFILTEATIEDLEWIKNTKEVCTQNEERAIKEDNPALSEEEIASKASRQYFGAFRSEFAKKFYPELFITKKTSKKKDDSLLAAIEARMNILNTCNV